jgi:hypothetical protein
VPLVERNSLDPRSTFPARRQIQHGEFWEVRGGRTVPPSVSYLNPNAKPVDIWLDEFFTEYLHHANQTHATSSARYYPFILGVFRMFVRGDRLQKLSSQNALGRVTLPFTSLLCSEQRCKNWDFHLNCISNQPGVHLQDSLSRVGFQSALSASSWAIVRFK